MVPDDIDNTLADRAYQKLEEMLVTLQLRPGTLLSEQVLAKTLEVGRTPVREALRRLEHSGLVVILPRRGILVSELNVQTQLNLLETRREIERLLARLSAQRASADQRKEFAQISAELQQLSEHSDETMFARLDNRLTELEYEACRNVFAVRSMSMMHGLSRRFWVAHYRNYASLLDTAALHADLAAKIGGGDAASAAAASDALLDYIEAFTKKTVA